MSRRGSLFVIGGAADCRSDQVVLQRFVEICGGPSARLLVLTTASSQPERKRSEYEEALDTLGVRKVVFFHQERRDEAEREDVLEAVNRADGVFLTGGGQLRLVTTIGGTSLDARLRKRYREGLHLGGTSAGASAFSTVMIARGRARAAPRISSVVLSPGLGLLSDVIVDQHFRERDRFGRLLAAILRNPAMLGFGVDEGTAFVLDPMDRVSVVGKGTLTIVDGSELEGSNLTSVAEDLPVSFAGMRVHVLGQGWFYDLARRKVEMPQVSPT